MRDYQLLLSVLLTVYTGVGWSQQLAISPSVPEGRPHVLKIHQKYQISCLLKGADKSDSVWWEAKSDGNVVIKDVTNSVFTMESSRQEADGSLTQAAKLIFNNAGSSDAGAYFCKANVGGQKDTRKQAVSVVVLSTAQFVNADTRVGGLPGSIVHVNCDAKHEPGTPEPTVTFHVSGFSKLPTYYSVVGSMLTINKLHDTDDGRRVTCMASQTFPALKETMVEQKVVTIDVYSRPILDDTLKVHYAILYRNATIKCRVVRSKPAVNAFTFYRGNQELVSSNLGKYQLDVDYSKQEATLTITNVTLVDYTNTDAGTRRYSCNAQNGQATSEMEIELRQTFAPGNVSWSLESCTGTRITYKLQSKPIYPSLQTIPASAYEVKYMRKSVLTDLKQSMAATGESDAEPLYVEQLWRGSMAITKKFPAAGQWAAYSIAGLLPNTWYVFRIRAHNAAGPGNWTEIVTQTVVVTPRPAIADEEPVPASEMDKPARPQAQASHATRPNYYCPLLTQPLALLLAVGVSLCCGRSNWMR